MRGQDHDDCVLGSRWVRGTVTVAFHNSEFGSDQSTIQRWDEGRSVRTCHETIAAFGSVIGRPATPAPALAALYARAPSDV